MRQGIGSVRNHVLQAWQRHHGFVLSGAGSFFSGAFLVFLAVHNLSVKPNLSLPILSPTESSAPAVIGEERPPVLEASVPAAVPDALPVPQKTPEPRRSDAAIAAPPLWQRNAVAAPADVGKPMVAVIIDDVGLDRPRSRRAMALPWQVTISLMSYAGDAQRQADDARAHGHELMMHVPMQPLQAHFDAGPDALNDALPPDELHRRIEANLDRFTGYVGINNHMGSQFTQNRSGMMEVMAALHRRGLLFIDSVTIAHSVGLATAREAGVPSAARDVFIDNDSLRGNVDQLLTQVEVVARRKGTVIAIGHPHDGTLEALNAWLPTLAAKGLVLVPVTAIVAARRGTVREAGAD